MQSVLNSRLFVGIAPPKNSIANLEEAARRYRASITTVVPATNLHMTLIFLGDVTAHADQLVSFSEPLAPSFLPTVSITHLGRGLQPKQLWAYVQATPALQSLREIVQKRLEDIKLTPRTSISESFVPHITLAKIEESVSALDGMDSAAVMTFPVREVVLWQSVSSPNGATYQRLAQALIER